MRFIKSRWSLPLAALVVTFVGGGCGGDDSAGDYEILDEGEGQTNELPLRTLGNGQRFQIRRDFQDGNDRSPQGITRGPFQMGSFEVYRDIFSTRILDSLNGEIFHFEDAAGVWLVGGSEDGLLPKGVLTVPATVRLGMRWRSTPASSYETFTFEVLDRQVEDSELGEDTVFWLIGQIFEASEEPLVYRWYAEGWGQLSVANRLGPVPTVSVGERLLVEGPARPAALVPEFDLTPADPHRLPLEGNRPGRLDIIRGIRSTDGARTHLSVVGSINAQNNEGIGSVLTYNAAAGAFARRAFEGWTEPLLESRDSVGFAGRYDIVGLYGNAIYSSAGLFASTTDDLFFENPAGGVDGFRAQLPFHNGNGGVAFLAEETVVVPGFESLKGQLWGATGVYGTRTLQGAANQTHWHYGVEELSRPALWLAETEDLEYGKVSKEAHFVDSLIEPVSTLTTVEGDVHYIVSSTGFVERMQFGVDGAKRESLGKARVPQGHTLRAAIELGDGRMALATHETATEDHFLWIAETPNPTPGPATSGVAIDEMGLDVRVCWRSVDEPLDTSGWSLGGVAALATVPLGNDCALVLRDLAARPVPAPVPGVAPPGWDVVEGPVPGVGRLRGLVDTGVDVGPGPLGIVGGNGAISAWKVGGGFSISDTTGTRDHGRGGTVLGAPALEPRHPAQPRYPTHSGEGVWVPVASMPTIGVDGSVTTPNGYVLTGPRPQFFPFNPSITGPANALRALNTGGLLIPTASVLAGHDHLGLAILRTDGSVDELTHPGGTTPMVERQNGELCGTRSGSGTTFLYCATPAGVVRETSVGSISITDLVATPVKVTPLIGDRIAVLRGQNARITAVDFETLTVISYALPAGYEDSRQLQQVHLGPDDLVYGRLMHPNNVDSLVGAFTATGFVAADDLSDVRSYLEEGAEGPLGGIGALLVTEDIVYLQSVQNAGDSSLVRIPRSFWDIAVN